MLLLIAPLWNWNSNHSVIFIHNTFPFNRTFMELKRLFLYTHSKKWYDLLIAPLWNWNLFIKSLCYVSSTLLIAPLWNWNIVLITPQWCTIPFNRTFMELKRISYAQGIWREVTFNRTFMELKRDKLTDINGMKLHLLIAPLWNWNSRYSFIISWISDTFNRTFMELKQNINNSFTDIPRRF